MNTKLQYCSTHSAFPSEKDQVSEKFHAKFQKVNVTTKNKNIN